MCLGAYGTLERYLAGEVLDESALCSGIDTGVFEKAN